MKKEERIKRYGEAAYEKMLQQNREWAKRHRKEIIAKSTDWNSLHREEHNAHCKKWREANQDVVKINQQEYCCKGGKYYDKYREYNKTGLRGERERVRRKHHLLYRIIRQATPNSVLHHEWVPGTAEYRGVALVEKEAHSRGIIKVIMVLEGGITVFTEKEIKEQEVI